MKEQKKAFPRDRAKAINSNLTKERKYMDWVITFAVCFAAFFAIGIKVLGKKK